MESVGGYASIISNGNEILTDKYVVYMRIGYVYVVVIAAAALGSMLYGNDPSSAGQTIINYLKLDIENPIIRINTAFKGCSSLEKISVLPRIYHN